MRYTFLNKKTNKTVEMDMPYSELEKYLNHNPHMEQVFKLNVADPVNIGVTKPPVDFQKYVLGKVKEMPGAQKSVIEKRWTIPKET